MTLLYRRLLTIFFLFGFLVATPILVLYASGYRYNFELKRIERTGLLHVTTDPQDTKMVLNGQLYEVGNELIKKGLKPGNYDIIILKDGYHSWYKTLKVNAGESTFIRDLLLFRNETPSSLEVFADPLNFLGKTSEYTLFESDNKLYVFLFSDKSLHQIDLANTGPISHLSLDSNTVIFQQDDKWWRVSLLDYSLKDLSGLLPSKNQIVLSSDNRILSLTDSAIWQLFAEENIDEYFELIYSQGLPQTVLISDNRIWLIATEPARQRSFLYSILNTSSRPRMITSLPYSSEYQIAEDYNGFLTVYDSANNNLNLIDISTQLATIATLNGVHSWEWSKDHTQLLTASDFELTIHHIQNGRQQELLRRISTPITDAVWHPEEMHGLFVSNDSLMLVERDSRNERNVIPLIENKKDLRILYVDPTGEKILLSSASGNVGGIIWELPIR